MPSLDPQRWTPPPVPAMTGEYAPNALLDEVELVPVPGHGPEDPLPDGEGGLVVGLDDGRIVRVALDGHAATGLADTGGRPLGLAWLPDGDLLVCDAHRGLLRMPRTGGPLEVLVEAGPGPQQVSLANNAAVADDGTIWFSDSSRSQPLDRFTEDIIEHRGTGRLLRLDTSGELTTVLDGFTFTNGVALTAAQDALLVASTGDHTLTRVELRGPSAGEHRVLRSTLPGFPDNLSTAPDGTIWCAMPAPRNPAVDLLAPRHPALRQLVVRLPEAVRPKPERMAFVLGFDEHGEVVANLQGSGDAYHFITGVHEHDGWLYLGSESHDATAVARVRRP